MIPVRLSWKKYSYFSGHCDVAEAAKILSAHLRSRILLNHGEPEVLQAMQQNLKIRGFQKVEIAKAGWKYFLDLE